MRAYIWALALSSIGLLHVLAETPAQPPLELAGNAADAADEDDTRNYMARAGVSDLAPPSHGEEEGGGLGTRRLAWWRMHPSPELLDALRAALAVESEVMELRNANDDAFDLRPSGDWPSSSIGTGEGGMFGSDGGRQLPKRAPTGFTGMRGRRIPSGFNGMRGKKSFSLFSWNNQAQPGAPKSFRDGKRAPSGFLGMRGKKSSDTSLDEQWTMDDLSLGRPAKEYANFLVLDPAFGSSLHVNPAPLKRVPNGFMGLRGRKDCI